MATQENPSQSQGSVLRDVISMLSPEEELADLVAAEESVNDKDRERRVVLDNLEEELAVLAHKLHNQVKAAERPENHPSAADHEAHVRSLEQQQYTAHKQLADDAGVVAKREVELGRAKAEREEVRKWDVASADRNDGEVLRAQIFHGMGFTLMPDSGASTKILVRNDAKPDVNIINVDPAQKVHYANLLWDLAG